MSAAAVRPASLDSLGSALADVAAADAAALPTLAQGERIQELLRLGHVLDAAIASSVRAFDAGRGPPPPAPSAPPPGCVSPG